MRILFVCIYIVISQCASAQIIDDYNDERPLYAATKQVNQFFRRFNNEEAPDGSRLYSKDSLYRNTRDRLKYLKVLFDNDNKGIKQNERDEFVKQITDKKTPAFLDFHGGEWFAQVNSIFIWHGKEERVTLFLKLQEEKVGSKWILSKVYFPEFAKLFNKDTTDNVHFLHPLSHELDFMNIYKAFEDNRKYIDDYTGKDYEPDFLTLFLYEIKRGNLKFKTVDEVKFHFFQIKNWYFELSNFNRKGYNTGWLISNLVKVNPKEKEVLLKYIYTQ